MAVSNVAPQSPSTHILLFLFVYRPITTGNEDLHHSTTPWCDTLSADSKTICFNAYRITNRETLIPALFTVSLYMTPFITFRRCLCFHTFFVDNSSSTFLFSDATPFLRCRKYNTTTSVVLKHRQMILLKQISPLSYAILQVHTQQ